MVGLILAFCDSTSSPLHVSCTTKSLFSACLLSAFILITPFVSKACYYSLRRAWAVTGIVVRWFVCLFVTHESSHLDAIAQRLHHG